MQPNGDMLRLARQRKGFPQTEAAKRLDIDQSLLSRMENGVSEIRDEILVRAEAIYDVRRSFFFQSDPIYGVPVSVHPMWRKKADVSGRDVDAVVAELNMRVMHLRRFLEAADVAKVNDLPRLDIEDYGDPERIASLVRSHWKVPAGSVRDLTVLVERAGILVVHSNMAGASISGVTFSAPGMPPLVVLNSDQPADRMRFTLAHELGHLVMHRFPSPDMENEAHAFASALLMPAGDVQPLLQARRIDLPLLASLKSEWKVSMQSIIMRAKSLGLLTRNQEEYLWKQMSVRKWRMREPAELDFPHETPSVIANLVKIFRDHLGYSAEEISKLLHIPEPEFRKLYPSEQTEKTRPKFTVIG
jgi:Zn-dependent peptidase ImmA (M78 family)